MIRAFFFFPCSVKSGRDCREIERQNNYENRKKARKKDTQGGTSRRPIRGENAPCAHPPMAGAD